ncbi:MAG: enoyl-CoA hydratase/isomerase family protein [Candidatus Promineifilaceae bacterium]
MKELVLREDTGSVAVVTLNRPERHNSLVPELLEALLDAVYAVESDPAIRAMVLQSNGRSFSTGGDAQGFVNHQDSLEEYSRTIVGLLNEVMRSMMELRMPIVTAVHGIVTGGAMGLVLASDIVLVTAEASFTPYYSEVGVSPDGGWTALLPSIIGINRAATILILNETITAGQALDWGIAMQYVPAGQIRNAALETAIEITRKKPSSLAHTKKLLRRERSRIKFALEEELEHFVQQITSEEGTRAFSAFLEKLRSDRRRDEIIA